MKKLLAAILAVLGIGFAVSVPHAAAWTGTLHCDQPPDPNDTLHSVFMSARRSTTYHDYIYVRFQSPLEGTVFLRMQDVVGTFDTFEADHSGSYNPALVWTYTAYVYAPWHAAHKVRGTQFARDGAQPHWQSSDPADGYGCDTAYTTYVAADPYA